MRYSRFVGPNNLCIVVCLVAWLYISTFFLAGEDKWKWWRCDYSETKESSTGKLCEAAPSKNLACVCRFH